MSDPNDNSHLNFIPTRTEGHMNIKNRIVEQRTIPARELKPHPHNWRKHPKKQRAAFRAVLDEIGRWDAHYAAMK